MRFTLGRRPVGRVALTIVSMWLTGWVSVFAVPVSAPTSSGAGPLVGLDDALNAASLSVVAEFLGLAPPQLAALTELIDARARVQAPLQARAHELQRRLEQALTQGRDPAEVGLLAGEIFDTNQALARAQAEFLTHVEGVLLPDQLQRWAFVHHAARLHPIVPAFRRLSIHR